jgi:hypothetical protein
MFQDLSSINNAGRSGDFVRARSLALNATQSYPNNAQAWYYLAQADGQLGNVKEATTSLARADQLDPTHSFVGNVNSYNALRAKLATVNQAVIVHDQNDYSVSHPGEGSHPFVWGFFILAFALVAAYVIKRLIDNGAAARAAEEALEEARRIKARADAKLDTYGTTHSTGYTPRTVHAVRPASVTPAYHSPSPSYNSAPAQQAGSTTIINNGNSSDGLLTGLLVGEALAGGHNHDTYVEHDVEVVHDEPVYTSGRSSGWDSGSSSSSSSSSGGWDSGSSSSSSSSSSSGWDSGSSSSSYDSGSSSSWDSGSSSSDFSSSSDSSGW